MYWAGWWYFVCNLGTYASLCGASMKISLMFMLCVCLSVLALLIA
jgi:hypothetical protein